MALYRSVLTLLFTVTLTWALEVSMPSCEELSITCSMACEHGFRKDAAGCSICECSEEVCKDVQCTIGKVCRVFTLSASGHKISRCIDPRLPENCHPPLDTGPCKAFISSYFYNSENGDCETFVYGGCKGNNNKFKDLESCETYCVPKDLKPGCSEITCRMFCEHGYRQDARGCDLCECRDPEQLNPLGECDEPHTTCLMACDNGFKKDMRGCPICECEDLDKVNCDEEFRCAMACPLGFKKDARGCDVCECLDSKAVGLCQDEPVCLMSCPNGFKKDLKGCNKCECNLDDLNKDRGVSREDCKPVFCAMWCDKGFKKDTNGCYICQCVGMEYEIPGCLNNAQCRIFCEYGFMKDTRGCEVCKCRDNPCHGYECGPELKCTLHKTVTEDPTPKCVDINERTWCHNKSCKKMCRDGFQTDERGCEVCRCRDSLPEECTEPVCRMMCDYGFKYDTDSCRTCACLPDPCSDNTCDNDHVCETVIHKKCPTCPAIGDCIYHHQVQRITIELHFIHSPVEEIDEGLFVTQFKRRMSYLLNIDEEYIKGVTVKHGDVTQTIVRFQVVSYGAGDLVGSYRRFEIDIKTHEEGTALKYNDIVFVPEHRSLVATYSRYPEFEGDDVTNRDNSGGSNLGVIIGCTIAGAVAVVLLIIVIVFIVKSKKKAKKHDRPNVGYIRTDQQKKRIVNDIPPKV